MRLCTALQFRHKKTPYVAEAHEGFLPGQSKQTLFSFFDRNFFKIAFFSADGTQFDVISEKGKRFRSNHFCKSVCKSCRRVALRVRLLC